MRVRDELGYTTACTYDTNGNRTSITDALSNTTTNQYDSLSRLTASTNPLNQRTRFAYDELGRLIQVTDPMNKTAGQQFDSNGNRVALTDPAGNTQHFTYDPADRLTGISSPTGSRQYAYNLLGYLAGSTNGRNQTQTCAYDAAGRLISQTDPDGAISYTYDNNSNILTVTDAAGNTIGYTYDQAGNLTGLTYPDGKQVHYTYDAANRLTGVTDWAGRTTAYSYDPNGRLTQTTRPNGTTETRSYDENGRLTELKDTGSGDAIISHYNWEYNAAGNITAEITPNPGQSFVMGNQAMTYTTDNRLANYNGSAISYDADGNMTTGPLQGTMQNLTYDSRNRLTAAGGAEYTYDAENRRIATTIGGQQTSYVINPHAALSQVLIKTDPNNTATYYIYGLGLIGEESGGTYKTYHYDLRGSTVAITGPTGTVTDRFQYGPYGEVQRITGHTATPFLYNGRDGVMTDANGLYHMRARYYNPGIMRFINRDVITGSVEETLSLNRYIYCQGDPVNLVDPTGHNPYVRVIQQAGQAVVRGASCASWVWSKTGGRLCRQGQNAAGKDVIEGAGNVPNKVTDLAKNMKDWLGKDARVITNKNGDKVFMLGDGTKRIRFDINNPSPHNNPHGHVEELVNGKWVKSGPIYPTDVPHN